MKNELPEINEAELLAELDLLMVRPPKQYMSPLLYNICKHARENNSYFFSWEKLANFLTEKGLWNKKADALHARYMKEKKLRGD